MGEWQEAISAGKNLTKVLHGSGIPDGEEIEKAAKEMVDRLTKLQKKMGSKAAQVLQFAPLGHCVSSIRKGFDDAAAWVQNEAKECMSQEEDCSLTVHLKCRVPISRRFDLLEAIIESYVKHQADTADKAMGGILAKTQMKAETEKAIAWWKAHFGKEMIVAYDVFFREYFGEFSRFIAQKGEKGVEEWKTAISHCADYTQDQTVTAHEFGFFCLWWYPGSYSPRSLNLLLKQGYFQPFGDRKNFQKFLRTPGDYFVRNTVNQGGGWCVSYIDPYLKAKHVLLNMRCESGTMGRGWEFSSASDPARQYAVSVVGIIQKNTDCLQIPRGARYDNLPTVDWDGYTHAQGEHDEASFIAAVQDCTTPQNEDTGTA